MRRLLSLVLLAPLGWLGAGACAHGQSTFGGTTASGGTGAGGNASAGGGQGGGDSGGGGAGSGATGAGGSSGCDPANPGTVTCGQGLCQVSVTACDAQGNPVPCVPLQPAPAEACGNGQDDDCDGATDEGCVCTSGATQACYSGAPGTKDKGVCKGGTQTCTNGQWGGCLGEITPAIEICDNKDNNCEGHIDEGNPGGGMACTTAMPGPCAPGTMTCMGAALTCKSNVSPVPEVCGDGIDNDCTGVVDNGCCAHDVCVTGVKLTSGCTACVTQICAADSWCCNNAWDSQCVSEVTSVCGQTCS
jgi:hypothetical protein